MFGVGTAPGEKNRWANILGCEVGQLPFQYLGVPVGANMNLKKNWKPIIDRFNAKLSIWKAKTLSFGGRLTLLKAVLGNLPTYYLSLFKAPVGVIESLERSEGVSYGGGLEIVLKFIGYRGRESLLHWRKVDLGWDRFVI